MKINIKDILDQQNISRYELAKRIGVTYPTITSIYKGETSSIKLEILEAICKELDCIPDDILICDDEYLRNQQLERVKRLSEYYNRIKNLGNNKKTAE